MEVLPYDQIRDRLESFDLVLFDSPDFISEFIQYLQKRHLKPESIGKELANISNGAFSHVGMIVKSDILRHPAIEEGKVYIWESVISGPLGGGVTRLDGKSFLGLQVRDFDEIVPAFSGKKGQTLGIAKLNKEWRDRIYASSGLYQELFTELFNKLDGAVYDGNPISLLSALYKWLRCCRCKKDYDDDLLSDSPAGLLSPDGWLFCSEHVALVYREMGFFPRSVQVRNVLPMDFLGFDTDEEGGVPLILDRPFCIVPSA